MRNEELEMRNINYKLSIYSVLVNRKLSIFFKKMHFE